MEVKKGFKQTEVGELPQDWETQALGQLISLRPTYGINASAVAFDSRLPTYLRITDISEDGRFAEAGKVAVDHPLASHYVLEPGDVVFARTGASVGKSYRYRSSDGKLVFAGFLIRIRPATTALDSTYLSYFAQSQTFWNWVKINSMRSGQPGINGNEFASLPIPLPPTLAEQEAIAGALSDADAWIESLEQLIAKKRQIKQGAMQELLTGKIRLPGFTGEWMPTRLGELGGTYGGLTGKSKADFGTGTAKYVTFMNVMTNTVIDDTMFEPVCVSPSENQHRVESGDLLFNGSSETPEEVALCSLVINSTPNLFLNSFCFGLRPWDDARADGLFVTYYIRSSEGREIMKSLAQGSTRYNLSKRALRAAEIRLPERSEQVAIASVLSDIDAEIESLEAKLAKARQIKQGMMQELLTGRIRLV